MRNENIYLKNRREWDSYIDKLSSKMVSSFNFVSKFPGSEKMLDDVYDFLTNNGYDEKGFEFVYQSAKIENPGLSRKNFFKKYIHQPTGNILDTIDNNATSERIVARLQKDLKPLSQRVARLNGYKKGITKESVEKQLKDVERIIGYNKTVEKNTRKKIKELDKVLRRKRLTIAERRAATRDRKELKRQLSVTIDQNKNLTKRFKTFQGKYKNLPPSKLKQQYTTLLNRVENDVVKKQQKVVIDQTVRASGSSFTKRTSQTEFAKNATQKDTKFLKNDQEALPDQRVLLVKYFLSASHNILDICDSWAKVDNGWGPGVWPLYVCPVPVTDTHPHCQCGRRTVGDAPITSKNMAIAEANFKRIKAGGTNARYVRV